MRVRVIRYNQEASPDSPIEELGRYEGVEAIMPLAAKSPGVAWVSFRFLPNEVSLALERGFHVEQVGSWLDVLPDTKEDR